MDPIIIKSVLFLAGLGCLCGIVLSIASVVFQVYEDPRVEAVLDVLPGANCGGCGFAGCSSYAAAVVNDPNVGAGACVAGGADTSEKVGELTGKSAGSAEPMISVRRCVKDDGQVALKYEYQGVPSCAAAHKMGGADACEYSCLGFGDCVKACPFGAMIIHNGLVRIDPALCIGCGVCVRTCPRGILEVIPANARVMIYCSSTDKGKAVTSVCKAGCISCLACTKKCPAKAIKLVDKKIVIDHKKCLEYGDECEMACLKACKKRKIIRVRENFAEMKQAA